MNKIQQKLLKLLNYDGFNIQISKLTKRELNIIDTYFTQFEPRDNYGYVNLYISKSTGLTVLYFNNRSASSDGVDNNFLKQFTSIRYKLK